MSSDSVDNAEKAPKKWGSRLSFLRTKRAISALVLLSCAVIAIIALAATHTIGGGASGGSSQHSSTGGNNGTDSEAQSASSGLASAAASNSTPTTNASSLASTQPTATLNSSLTSTLKATTTSVPKSTFTSAVKTSSSTATPTSGSSTKGSIADGTPLRIMCLGASIVKGETSPGTVGFRPTLRDTVAALGAPVNMVGGVKLGSMIDNDVEAFGGYKITQIHDASKAVVPAQLPNVFVINDGTNNVLQQVGIDTAGADMEDFIDYLLETSPRALVVLSTLLTNTVGGGSFEKNILDINTQFRNLTVKLIKEGKPVVLAEMHPSSGLPNRPTTSDIGPDGSHPTVAGYEKMGIILAAAVQEGDEQGLLQIPVAVKGIPNDGQAGQTSATTATTAATVKKTAAAARRRLDSA